MENASETSSTHVHYVRRLATCVHPFFKLGHLDKPAGRNQNNSSVNWSVSWGTISAAFHNERGPSLNQIFDLSQRKKISSRQSLASNELDQNHSAKIRGRRALIMVLQLSAVKTAVNSKSKFRPNIESLKP